MARNTFSRFLRGAVNTGAATYPLGKAAIPLAIGGGILEAATGGTPKFDRKPYDKAFNNYVTGVRRDTRSMARELGSQRGARLAARGINESGVGDYLHGQNNTRLYAQSQRHINDARANLESQIGHAENMMQQGADARERQQWGETRNYLMQELQAYANPESGGPTDKEMWDHAVARLRQSTGMTDGEITQWLLERGWRAPAVETRTGVGAEQTTTSPISGVQINTPTGEHNPFYRSDVPIEDQLGPYHKRQPQETSNNTSTPTNPFTRPDPNLGDGISLPGHAQKPKKSPAVVKGEEHLGSELVSYLDAVFPGITNVFDFNA